MIESPPFPDIEDSDTDDVNWSIETGRSMWQQGDAQEALRWLKRAAERAEESGNDARSLSLAKAAADLRAYLEREHGGLSDNPAPAAPNLPAPGSNLPPSAPNLPRAAGSQRPPQAHRLPPPPAPPGVHAASPPRETSSTAQSAVPAPSVPPLRSFPPPRGIDRRDAVRVSVQPVDEKPGVYVLRPLGPGEHAARGVREALLVSLDGEPALPD